MTDDFAAAVAKIKPEGIESDRAPSDAARAAREPGPAVYSPADHVLFTHALLFTHARLDVDPAVEWAVREDKVGEVGVMVFPGKLFSGLVFPNGDDAWCRRLLFIDKELWPSLELALAGVTVVSPKAKYYARAFRHLCLAPDPTVPGSPTTMVYAIGLSAIDGLYWLESGMQPYVQREPPEEDTIREAKILLGDY